MTKDDILSIAKQAGIGILYEYDGPDHAGVCDWKDIERFAALVAEKATEQANARQNASWALMCKKMVAAEREKSLQLWLLLDDIDTADDIAKADDDVYRKLCQLTQKKRWAVLGEFEIVEALQARGQK
jgi:hypothetical protein